MTLPEIDLKVYSDECDTFGHLNQAAFLRLFERARWEMLEQGPGLDLFASVGVYPAVRKATIDYQAPAFPGDVLRFSQSLIYTGSTSFSMRQVARRLHDGQTVATGEFIFVCIDQSGKPAALPEKLGSFMHQGVPTKDATHQLTVNGVRLAFESTGEGPAILFIHGYPLNRSIWRHQIGALEGWRRIAPDLRGMGESDAPDLGYSMATYAADLIALLDAIGVEKVVLCALSMGGYVAFEIVRAHRARVSGLVLVATKAVADSVEGRKARDMAAATARERGAAAVAESMLPKMVANETSEQIRQQVLAMMESTPVPGIVGALTAMRDRPDSSSLLSELASVPTLVLAGESDQLIPLADITRMADAIPSAEFRVVPRAAHLVPVEQPGVTTQIIQGFLDSLGLKPSGSLPRR
ncbi:MAG: alpha/beta fold hydrolase [Gemmatimonadota bacterium]